MTVVGHTATISAGEWITASGEWINDRTHGQQFKARFLEDPDDDIDVFMGIEPATRRAYSSAGLYRAERAIAERLLRLVNGKLPWPWIDPDKALPWVEQRSGLQLAESQKTAIRLALMSKVLVITGGPGVGKTTIVKSILRVLSAKSAKLLLCAPTGRAAKRMTEPLGSKPRPSTAFSRSTQRVAASSAMPTTASTATCW